MLRGRLISQQYLMYRTGIKTTGALGTATTSSTLVSMLLLDSCAKQLNIPSASCTVLDVVLRAAYSVGKAYIVVIL